MMNWFRQIHFDSNHLTICCWNKFWHENFEPNQIFVKTRLSKSKCSILKKTILMLLILIILSNLPNCSHRGCFLPIWSFWYLFWNWCWWWTLFVFSDIFESDHQTVSIRTIEILKNHLTFVKITTVVWLMV